MGVVYVQGVGKGGEGVRKVVLPSAFLSMYSTNYLTFTFSTLLIRPRRPEYNARMT